GPQPMLSLNASGGRLVDRIRRLLGESPMTERRSTTWTIAAALAVVTLIVGTPGRTVADASEPVPPLESDGLPPRSSQAPALRAERDARAAVRDADWAAYARQTQAALETLA